MTSFNKHATVHYRLLGSEKTPGLIIGADDFTDKAANDLSESGQIELLKELRAFIGDFRIPGVPKSDVIWQVQFWDHVSDEQRVYEVDAIEL